VVMRVHHSSYPCLWTLEWGRERAGTGRSRRRPRLHLTCTVTVRGSRRAGDRSSTRTTQHLPIELFPELGFGVGCVYVCERET